jgi:hypothetical protein
VKALASLFYENGFPSPIVAAMRASLVRKFGFVTVGAL